MAKNNFMILFVVLAAVATLSSGAVLYYVNVEDGTTPPPPDDGGGGGGGMNLCSDDSDCGEAQVCRPENEDDNSGPLVCKTCNFIMSVFTECEDPTPPPPTCTPSAEVCDQKDNDCDGQVDEGACNQPPPPAGVTDYMTISPSYIPPSHQKVCTERKNPLIPKTNAGLSGKTRIDTFDTLVDAWFKSGNVIQTVGCTKGQCLWVPWYSRSDSCNVGDLHRGGNCNIGTVDFNNNCQVTDEFSQVAMVLAMSDRSTDVNNFMNTIEATSSGKYGISPVWRVSRQGTNINPGYTSNRDTASDATARLIIALYTAANNDRLSSSVRSRARTMGDTMSEDFIKHEFYHKCEKTRNYGTICHWSASGGDAGHGGFAWGNFAYGGYQGDIMLALIAAYKNTGKDIYKHYAQDTARQFLAASEYTGSSLRTAAFSYGWKKDSQGYMYPVCQRGCTGTVGVDNKHQWDDADAVRQVTVCKAQYEASLAGFELDPMVGQWCKQITEVACYADNGWCVQLRDDGSSWRSPQGGYKEAGLGSSLNFWHKQQDLIKKLDTGVNGHFNTGSMTFDGQSCMGVYNQAFIMVNYGSSIGLDQQAYGTSTGSFCTS